MKISWCITTSKKDKRRMKRTLDSIKQQSIKPYEIIITGGDTIAEGRTEYLMKAKGNIIISADVGCLYEKDYTKKMLKKLKGNDIVIAKVVPIVKNMIQQFCALRQPLYDQFSQKDWDTFIPSNRQVMFKKKIIDVIGYPPDYLYRSDDTYWFQRARDKKLKFAYCPEAIVYWEMKTTLKSYLRTIYLDTKCDYQVGIKRYKTKRISVKIFPYGIFVCILALIYKFKGMIVGTNAESLREDKTPLYNHHTNSWVYP